MLKISSITVLGLGNILLKDDGIGVWLLRGLERYYDSAAANGLPDGVLLHEVGTAVFSVPALQRDDTCLLLLDALQGGEQPGTVYRFKPEEVGCQLKNTGPALSLHDFRLQHILALPQPGKSGPCHIFGVEPAEIGFGYGLTPGLQAVLPLLVDILVREIVTLVKTIQPDNMAWVNLMT